MLAPPVEAAIEAELPADAEALIDPMDAAAEEAIMEEAIIEEAPAEEAAAEVIAAEVEAAEDAPPAPPALEDAQAQTAAADVWTARPVVGPQVWRTQPKAALLIAALLAAPHWQT